SLRPPRAEARYRRPPPSGAAPDRREDLDRSARTLPRFEVESAGSEATRVNPLAIRAMEKGIDLKGHCDSANERCPIFPGEDAPVARARPRDQRRASWNDVIRTHVQPVSLQTR